jgi:hypothetical protein
VGYYPFGPPVSSGGGATPVVVPTGDVTGAGDAAAITAGLAKLPATGGELNFAPGNYYLKPGGVAPIVVPNGKTVMINGNGAVVNTVAGASGDVIRMYSSAITPQPSRSSIQGLIIDGTNAAANVTGLHFGDFVGSKLDLVIQNFNSAGSIGLNADNTVSWTENCDWRVIFNSNLSPVVHQVTTGHSSFGYSAFDYTIFAPNAGQNGMQILNGSSLYHGSLRIRGDFEGSGSPLTNAVLTMKGAAPVGSPNAGSNTLLLAEHIMIQAECFAGAFTPQTIFMDSANFAFAQNCYGIMDFALGAAAFSAATINTGQMQFTGFVNGDPSINPVQSQWMATNSPETYRLPSNFGANGTIPTTIGDMYQPSVLSANITIALIYAPFSSTTLGDPQRITVKLQQAASGGPFTVTWPKPGAPTTANPAVYWPGGVAPVMSPAANAIDIYDLETLDGIRWYGVAHQAMS